MQSGEIYNNQNDSIAVNGGIGGMGKLSVLHLSSLDKCNILGEFDCWLCITIYLLCGYYYYLEIFKEKVILWKRNT